MQNSDPLKPGYNFDAHLVAGLTPIIEGDELDFTIDRPNGMKGYIINITSKGEGTIFSGDQAFDVKAGDLLLFPPSAAHFYQRSPDSASWFHRWVYFRPRAFWNDWLTWQTEVRGVYVTRDLPPSVTQPLEELLLILNILQSRICHIVMIWRLICWSSCSFDAKPCNRISLLNRLIRG